MHVAVSGARHTRPPHHSEHRAACQTALVSCQLVAVMMKVAIVGATGPTGVHLVAELRKTDAAVRVIGRGMDKLARLFPDAAIERHPADILDAVATLRAVDDCIGLPGDQIAGQHPAECAQRGRLRQNRSTGSESQIFNANTSTSLTPWAWPRRKHAGNFLRHR